MTVKKAPHTSRSPSARSPAARSPAAKSPKLSKAGLKIVAGLEEALAFAHGEPVPGAVVHKPVDVAAIRARTKLSQAKFAEAFGIDVRTLQEWEQGRRSPERPAQLYLRMIEHEPAAVERTLKKLRKAQTPHVA